jgi:hypothetical protein
MTITLIDRIGSVTFQHGLLRVDCLASGPNYEERPSGTLLIPANQAGPVLQALIGAMQELDRRVREQVRQQADAAKPAATPTPSAEEATPALVPAEAAEPRPSRRK